MTYKDGLSATSSQLSSPTRSQSAYRQPSQQMHSTQTLLKLVACRQKDTESDSDKLTDRLVISHRHTGKSKLTGSGKNQDVATS